MFLYTNATVTSRTGLFVQTPLVLSSTVTLTEMSPDFQCVRQLIHNLMVVFCKNNANVISAMKECADVLRQILNSPQHPTLKNWCAEIVELVTTQVVSLMELFKIDLLALTFPSFAGSSE